MLTKSTQQSPNVIMNAVSGGNHFYIDDLNTFILMPNIRDLILISFTNYKLAETPVLLKTGDNRSRNHLLKGKHEL